VRLNRLYSTPPTTATRYLMALFTVALTVAVSRLAGSAPHSTMLMTSCAAVIVSTSYGGRGPGLLVTIALGLYAAYRLPPDHSLAVLPRYQLPLGMFVGTGLFVSLLDLRFSIARKEDLPTAASWQDRFHAPAEATADLTPRTLALELQTGDTGVQVSREDLYQWSRNCEHIRDLTWYTDQCLRIGSLNQARIWVRLARQIAASTGSELQQAESSLAEAGTPESQGDSAS
jgi:hypothetical protein